MKRSSWFRRLVNTNQIDPVQPAQASPASLESLEHRILFAKPPHVTNIIADNRGEVIIQMSRSLDPDTVKGRNIQMQTGGPDGLIGNADDQKVTTRVRWNGTLRRITIKTNELPADETYRIRMNAKTITAVDGTGLDGDWNGAGNPTGNGSPGHDVLFVSRRPKKGDDPVARFNTLAGNFNVQMFPDDAPQTVINFMHYVNEGAYDSTFFHRLVKDFIIQGGGYAVDRDGNRHDVHEHDPVVNEFNRAPLRGTIAMAKIPATDQFGNPIPGGGPDSATNEWFFNFKDNSDILNNQNGGFTVFGEITSNTGAIDTLNGYAIESFASPLGEMPVLDAAAVDARGGTLNLKEDAVTIRRVAMLNKLLPLVFI